MGEGFIGPDQLVRVKAQSSIVALAGEYTAVRRAGANFVACCCFHQERTPSMQLYEDQGRYHCFGCGAKGDAVELVMAKERLEFQDAIEFLARRAGIALEYTKPTGTGTGTKFARATLLDAVRFAQGFFFDSLWRQPAESTARTYLAGRGLTDTTCREFGLGWAPGHGALLTAAKAAGLGLDLLLAAGLVGQRDGRNYDFFGDRITFPICDRHGDPIAFSARILPDAEARAKAEGRSVGKYINSISTALYDKGATVWNLHRARAALKTATDRPRLIVMEGPTDVMAAHQAGVTECVAVLGTAYTADHARQLGRLLSDDGDLVLLFDGDTAGQVNAIKAVATTLAAGYSARVATLPGGNDPCDLLAAAPTDPRTPDQRAAARVAFAGALTNALGDLDHLLSAIATPCDLDDPRATLAACDRLLDALAPMPDVELRTLFSAKIAAALKLPKRDVAQRLNRLTGQSAPAPKNAPMVPAGQGSSAPRKSAPDTDADTAREERDGGFQRALVKCLGLYLASLGVVPDAVGGWMDVDGKNVNVKRRELVNGFLFQHYSQFESLARERVDITLGVMELEQRQARRAAIVATLIGHPKTAAGEASARGWLKAVTGREDPVDYAVLLHWIWQVKRLQAGLSVSWDVMLIINGPQGSGKSTATERLCAPLKELVLDINSAHLTDERRFEVLADFAVGRWEEMQGASRSDVAALKHTISSRVVNYRELGSHVTNRLVRKCAFIGTTNESVDQLIADTTGARRYYQLTTPAKCDQLALGLIDCAQIWNCVSEDEPAPWDAAGAEIRDRQSAFVFQDTVDLWLQAETFGPMVLLDRAKPFAGDSGAPTFQIAQYHPDHGESFEHLVARYKYWCETVGQTHGQVGKLSARLKQLGFERRRLWNADTKRAGAYRFHLPAVIPDAWAAANAGWVRLAAERLARAVKLTAAPVGSEDLFAPKPAPPRDLFDEDNQPMPGDF